MKKIIATVLSMLMIIGASPMIFAYSDVESGTPVANAVTMLSHFDILDGFTDGTFKPNETITRAQMAKIVCEMLKLTTSTSIGNLYKDVPADHWAVEYINTISNLDIVCGYGDGNFGPEDELTHEQVIKIIVNILGYAPMAKSKGGYPGGYLAVANSIGLLKNVEGNSRGAIAVLIYNALHTPIMEQTSFGTSESYQPLDGTNGTEYKTLLTSRDVYIATGIVTKLDLTNDKITFTPSKVSKDGKFEKDVAETFYINNSDIADYIYQEVEVYVEENDDDYFVIGVSTTKKGETIIIISDDIDTVTNDEITYFIDKDNSSKKETIHFSDKVTVELNKREVDLLTTLYDGNNDIVSDIEITLIENNGDDDYDAIVMTKYTSVRVELVDTKKDKLMLNDGVTITFDFDDTDMTYIILDDESNELTLEDFEEDDVIAYMHDGKTSVSNAEYIKIIKLSNSVITGTIDSVTTSEKTVIINSVEYKVDDDYIWNKISKPGTEGTFYIGLTGKIVYFDGSTVIGKYGYILNSGTEGMDNDVIIKMVTEKGVNTYTLKKKVALDFDATEMNNKLVEYKINNDGLVSSLKKVDAKALSANTVYNSKTEMLDKKYIEEDTLVFIIDGEDSYTTDISYFVDEGTYKGTMFEDNNEVKVVVITDSDISYSNETGFAIVTGTSMATKNDETVFCVTFVQNEETGKQIYFEDLDYDEGRDKFAVGTVFVYNADTNGYVKATDKGFKIVSQIKNKDFTSAVTTDNYYGKNVKVVIGVIENKMRKTSSKGEVITVNGEPYVITLTTNKYTFITTNKNKIEVEDFLADEAYYGNSTPVLLKLVDDEVVDIYTISK